MRYGYTATGRADQHGTADQRQRLILAGVPAPQIWSERLVGTTATVNRPVWRALEARLRAGDELTVWRLDRIGRSVIEVVTTVSELVERGVLVRSLSDDIDPTTKEGRAKLALMTTLAALGREGVRARVKAGVAAARGRGVGFGRPEVDPDDAARRVRRVERLRETEGMTAAQAAQMVSWSRATYYRYRAQRGD